MSLNMDALEPVRRNVLRLMKQRKLSGVKLAKALGHSSSWASNFLSGRKTIPVGTVTEIAAYLDVPVWHLFAPADIARQGNSLAQGLGEIPTASSGMLLSEVSNTPIPAEVAPMPKDHEPDPLALLACLSKEEQEEVLSDLKRRVRRVVSSEPSGKLTAV